MKSNSDATMFALVFLFAYLMLWLGIGILCAVFGVSFWLYIGALLTVTATALITVMLRS